MLLRNEQVNTFGGNIYFAVDGKKAQNALGVEIESKVRARQIHGIPYSVYVPKKVRTYVPLSMCTQSSQA